MNVTVIGAGYVGLVSAACFADFGFTVTCIDTDAIKIANLDNGKIPIYEPGLTELVIRNSAARHLSFSTDLADAIKSADVIFVAVGTPSRRGDGYADLTFVFDVANTIAPLIDNYKVIVIKSTVPVGTGDEFQKIVAAKCDDSLFSVVSNPEFLREGAAIDDFKHPDRVVVGTVDQRAREVMSALYRPLSLNQVPIHFTDRRTSELIKYAANAFLATKITFINEMADLCEKAGANVQELARGIGLDRRIGPKFLHPGPGFGGSCFPKDTLALIKTAQDFGAPSRLVEAVADVNDKRKIGMAQRVLVACGGSVKGKTIAILGLTFKPNTDDMRESPALDIIGELQKAGATIKAFDPVGMENARQMLSDVTFVRDPYECLEDADAMVLVTEWDMLRGLDLALVKTKLKHPIIVDLRNVYRPEEMAAHGISYSSIGR